MEIKIHIGQEEGKISLCNEPNRRQASVGFDNGRFVYEHGLKVKDGHLLIAAINYDQMPPTLEVVCQKIRPETPTITETASSSDSAGVFSFDREHVRVFFLS